MKAFSPQGTYLLEHRKYRIRQSIETVKFALCTQSLIKGKRVILQDPKSCRDSERL